MRLEPRDETRSPHLPIDHFFKSLAKDRQAAAIGVILSGTGSDGTLGLEEIKAAGGITFAQDEQTARHTGMPQSAIRSGCVDLVLSPEEIARELARIGRHPYVAPHPDQGARPGRPRRAGPLQKDPHAPAGYLRGRFQCLPRHDYQAAHHAPHGRCTPRTAWRTTSGSWNRTAPSATPSTKTS